MIVNLETCIGCGLCIEVCPLSAISMVPEEKASISDICVDCKACAKVCPEEAIKSGFLMTIYKRRCINFRIDWPKQLRKNLYCFA